ncbi:MAG: type I restriction-modification system subunit M N-terminal domain-containing protein, partial [Xanthomonadales bacterium]|nr:type I restriction-modification system subunit M N-terminal domain-containing protein [Xanthomonadales bacterium]
TLNPTATENGGMSAADFKTYIFPLLFFKRICDVWDEEYQEIVDETGDEQLAWFPESHRFQIPEDCHWNDVRHQGVCPVPGKQQLEPPHVRVAAGPIAEVRAMGADTRRRRPATKGPTRRGSPRRLAAAEHRFPTDRDRLRHTGENREGAARTASRPACRPKRFERAG